MRALKNRIQKKRETKELEELDQAQKSKFEQIAEIVVQASKECFVEDEMKAEAGQIFA